MKNRNDLNKIILSLHSIVRSEGDYDMIWIIFRKFYDAKVFVCLPKINRCR